MKNAVFVLGMHRSGTSMLMRILNILGVYLGREEDVMFYGEDNPEGFWEHSKIVSIHDEIMNQLNRKWDSVTPLPDKWTELPEIIEYKKQLVNIVKTEFTDAPLWGMKDPRVCILLPLWLEIFEILNIEAKFIVSIRNPLDVANSLQHRNGMNLQKGIALWHYYTINIMEHTKSFNRLVVGYDSLIEETIDKTKYIAQFLNIQIDQEKLESVQSSIKSNLRHSKSTDNELLLYTSPQVVELYNHVSEDKNKLLVSESSLEIYKFFACLIELDSLEKLEQESNTKVSEVDFLNKKYELFIDELKKIASDLENDKEDFLISSNQSTMMELNEIRKLIGQIILNSINVSHEKEEIIQQLTSQMELMESENTGLLNKISKRTEKDIMENSEQAQSVKEKFDQIIQYESEIMSIRLIMDQAIEQSLRLASTKLFKVVHFLYRLKHQFIKGDLISKAHFFTWLKKRKGKYITDHSYNPIYQTINILDQYKQLNIRTGFSLDPQVAGTKTANNNDKSILKFDLKEKYEKVDIIILSIINYDFRYQRPQHLANSFSNNGHRVFYVNANFETELRVRAEVGTKINVCSMEHSAAGNIYSLHSKDEINAITNQLETMVTQYGVRDCFLVVEYPTWTPVVKYLKNKYGFRVVTDYLDDFTGFKDTTDKRLHSLSVELLRSSDRIIASSDYLADKAQVYNSNVEIIRNGTEFEHFNKVYNKKQSSFGRRKVVGYYGAIAHWFDFEKVEYLAKRLEDVDIVLIGSVTEGHDRLSKYPNIKLLGEKAYGELPEYLKGFDVCLIPFDTSTDLIKATNPVKYYEYLSTGKKVVATSIPELMPYKNKYVYLTNDNEEFFQYVKMCLEGNDELAPAQECIEFAKEHDWKVRGDSFISIAKEAFPSVSIIVLTYNQLDYTVQCISSIIEKTAYPNYELIIVDNNSMDDTPNYLRKLEKTYNHVKVFLNNENLGFAGGNNVGLRHATGDYIILLNNDTLVTRGWITGFIKHFEANHKLGLLGPVTNSIGNEAMINVGYKSIDDMEQFAYNYTLNHMGQVYGNIKALAMYCLVISNKALKDIGLLDENYKVGMFEDDDYSIAALKKGYEVLCAEDIFIHHYGSVSFKKLENKEYAKIFDENKKYFEEKWGIQWAPHRYREGILIGE
ncbi:glycosyltransferase [Paenibacillus sp. YIM B09110]|uniref:glycosyltransferase n=1 Tax=Paenibacillus sp. YIM B09110 TaxID=3126102 RepID=UPI00301BA3A9